MKQIFTLIAVMFSVSSFAADYPGPKNAKISISNNDRSMIQVKIDGKMYDLNNTFVMDNVRPGRHAITIYKTEIAGFRKRTSEIYNSAMFISTGQFISININRFGKVVTKTTTDKFDRDDRYNDNNRDPRDNRNNNYGRH
jgi:hypothetical protein